MKFLSLSLGMVLLLATGCANVRVTPAELKASSARPEERDDDLKRWREAVWLCNAFLNSTNRQTLPKGEIRLQDDGMVFVTTNKEQPVNIRCTTWGDMLVWFDFTAQERSDGFVVGCVQPKHERLFDNSFLKQENGQPAPNFAMAELALHEITHTYYRCGTVSFGNGFMYYLEAIFLFRYKNHSMEKLPFQTLHEFEQFIVSSLENKTLTLQTNGQDVR